MHKLFSERYKYKDISEKLNWENMTEGLRNRLWNGFYDFIKLYSVNYQKIEDLLYAIGDEFFKMDIVILEEGLAPVSFYPTQSLEYKKSKIIGMFRREIRNKFFNLNWYEVYDFLEFVFSKIGDKTKEVFEKSINLILEQENVPYRFINGRITPIIDREEILEIGKALTHEEKYKPARDHLEKALDLLSDRENPDYANSIKESISALESLVRIIKREKATFGQLIKELNLHPAFKDALSKLYGWTSDEGGIRHGKTGESLEPGLSEARFMLVLCSAFFNYLIEKTETGLL